MSRPIRIQYEGAVYHVMNRGNARQAIFKTPEHYQLFMQCLSETIDLWGIRLHAFSLMPNHYHLLIETPAANLARAMRHLNHVYTQRFNRMTRSDGHLFRGRYKSILVEDDAYLVELMRYIHLNPVKAGLVGKPEQHQWTSHRYYMKGIEPKFLTRDRILSYFGARKALALLKLHEFVMQGVPEELAERLSANRWPSVLSSENFESWVRWNFVKDLKDGQIEYTPGRQKTISEGRLRKVLSRHLGIIWSNMRNPRGRIEQKKRAQAIWFYRHHLKQGYTALSKTFGVVPSRITKIMGQSNLVSPELREQVAAALE